MAASLPIIGTAITAAGTGASALGSALGGRMSYDERAQRDFIRQYMEQNPGASNDDALQVMQARQNQSDLSFQQQQILQGEASQGRLMEQQNQYNIDAEQRSLNYSDPAFIRARYEAAGYNPNVALGTNPVSALGVTTPGSPAVSGQQNAGFSQQRKPSRSEQIAQKISELGQVFSAAQDLESMADERAARKMQLKALELQNQEQQQRIANQALEYAHAVWQRGRAIVEARHSDENHLWNRLDRQANLFRSSEAHNMDMGLKGLAFESASRQLVYDYNEEQRRQGRYDFERSMDALTRQNAWMQFRLANADLTDKEATIQWRKDHNGELPPTSVNSFTSSQPRSFVGKVIADAIGDGTGSGNNFFSKSWNIYSRFGEWLSNKLRK